ncbi:MAG TPA: hypothetical protein VKE92_05910, partial [Anaerolineales bacterium]|nr:hypothetical protein [Anaerolineales bacterium]
MQEFACICEGQPGSELFTFVVSAQTLLDITKIERFNEARQGVQRQLNYDHALKLRDYMRQPHASFAEPIAGNLEGSWKVDKEHHVINCTNGAYLLVDDGQHR